MKISKKVKGFRKEMGLTKAAFLKKNGATNHQVVGYLCQWGWARQAAVKDVEAL